MGDSIVSWAPFFRLSTGLVAITTGDVRCLFDVLGGDLIAKGTQQEPVLLLLTVSYCKHGSHNTTGSPYKSCGPICLGKACSNPSVCYLLLDERSLSHSAIFDNLPHPFPPPLLTRPFSIQWTWISYYAFFSLVWVETLYMERQNMSHWRFDAYYRWLDSQSCSALCKLHPPWVKWVAI